MKEHCYPLLQGPLQLDEIFYSAHLPPTNAATLGREPYCPAQDSVACKEIRVFFFLTT